MDHVDAFAIFAKVGELESISGAARTLGLPKANVSRAVAKLEATYKVSLLDRANRRLRLTEVGRTLHGHCLRVLDEMAAAEAQIAAHKGLPAGTLRIGCSADIGRELLAPAMAEFLDRYPDIDLRVRVGERLLPEPNSLDVVLHAGWLADSRLIVQKLADVRTLLVASRAYVERHGLPASVDDLANHAVLGNFYLDPAANEAGRLPAWVPALELVRGRDRHPVPIWRRFTATDHMMMLELVRQGVAIAPIAAVRIVTALQSGEMVRILPDYEIHDPAMLYALYTERLAVSPKLEAFLAFVNELIGRQRAGFRALGLMDESP